MQAMLDYGGPVFSALRQPQWTPMVSKQLVPRVVLLVGVLTDGFDADNQASRKSFVRCQQFFVLVNIAKPGL